MDGWVGSSLFDCPADRTRVSRRDVPILDPIRQGAPALLRRRRRVSGVVVVRRHRLGVGQHGREAVLPVHGAPHPLHVGVGEDVVRVGPALRRAVEERGPRVRHEALESPDVDQGADELLVDGRLQDMQQRRGGAELEIFVRIRGLRLKRGGGLLTVSQNVKMSS